MPFKDGEKNKEYLKKYYHDNKRRINAERILKQLKEGKQKRISTKTLESYADIFDDNQKEFLKSLVKNMQRERKILYEMPRPQPLLEVPIQAEDIPFVARLPEQQVFKENRNSNTFTVDEAKRVIHVNRRVDDGATEQSYYSKITAIMKKLNLDKTNGLWSDAYKAGFQKIVDALSGYKNPSNYIVVLLYVYSRSEKLKAIVDKYDRTLYEKLEEYYQDSQSKEKVTRRNKSKDDKTNYIQHYEDLFAIEKLYAETQYASNKHIIALLYSKGLLDDKGNLLIVPRNYWWGVELVQNDNDMVEKPSTAGNIIPYNFYNVKTGKMFLQSYKTVGKYKAITITLSKYAQKVIADSYKSNKRKYLFETKNNARYASSSSFNSQIGESVGLTVNQIRRAFINYQYHKVGLERDKLAKLAGHSVDVEELVYSTNESNEALQNTIYDEKVLGKKVNVKIAFGKNKGKTLVGVVSRSLKPNRNRFPYMIRFDPKDKEKDEHSDKIPDPEDGITMYEDTTTTRKTTTRRSKKN